MKQIKCDGCGKLFQPEEVKNDEVKAEINLCPSCVEDAKEWNTTIHKGDHEQHS